METVVYKKWEIIFNRFWISFYTTAFWAAVILVPLCMINVGNWVEGQWWDNLIGYVSIGISLFLGWHSSLKVLKSLNGYAQPYTKFVYELRQNGKNT
jgi:hypothetical protein